MWLKCEKTNSLFYVGCLFFLCPKILYSYDDDPITREGLHSVDLRSALITSEQEEIFVVPRPRGRGLCSLPPSRLVRLATGTRDANPGQ